ncbi:hypothetical protein EV421DRAFT_890154 [Armillaria borealis]|uniref:Secreted protein n=1 Tax=Armillaria borealis TaxID=47425 RepID=A0AA39K2K0_9AGAR|nr:hypothetical protein EV421DRAFT_890154 [Armillaria borealis]
MPRVAFICHFLLSIGPTWSVNCSTIQVSYSFQQSASRNKFEISCRRYVWCQTLSSMSRSLLLFYGHDVAEVQSTRI